MVWKDTVGMNHAGRCVRMIKKRIWYHYDYEEKHVHIS
jgi:hypothetical protein